MARKYIAGHTPIRVRAGTLATDLPELLGFEGLRGQKRGQRWTWTYVGYRNPRAGEFFVAGVIPQGFRAVADLDTPYHIVKLRVAYEAAQVWTPADPQPQVAK